MILNTFQLIKKDQTEGEHKKQQKKTYQFFTLSASNSLTFRTLTSEKLLVLIPDDDLILTERTLL
jgi:hypothetical protein